MSLRVESQPIDASVPDLNRVVPMSQPPNSPPLRELRGVVERITYQHPDNGYTVARIAPERSDAPLLSHDDRLVPIVGHLARPYPR